MKRCLGFCLLILSCLNLAAQTEIPELHVLGWSKQGHLAYCLFIDSIDPLGACTDFKFYIQDLITDKIVYKVEYFSQENLYSLAEVYALKQKEIDAGFAQYQISKQETESGRFPLLYQNESYNLDVRANYIQDDLVYPLFGMEVISPLVIDLMCPERGRKQVCSINGEAKIVNFDIFYFQSPYEHRIALFVALYVPGWEGLPLQGHYYVAGCHLRSGFKPYSPER